MSTPSFLGRCFVYSRNLRNGKENDDDDDGGEKEDMHFPNANGGTFLFFAATWKKY